MFGLVEGKAREEKGKEKRVGKESISPSVLGYEEEEK